MMLPHVWQSSSLGECVLGEKGIVGHSKPKALNAGTQNPPNLHPKTLTISVNLYALHPAH